MQLLKFFFTEEVIDPPYVIQPSGDPLSHPEVARMSLTELADLPMGVVASMQKPAGRSAKNTGSEDGSV